MGFHKEKSSVSEKKTTLGIANQTLDETIRINEIRQEYADHHMVTGPTKNILRQSSNNTNNTNRFGRNAERLFLEHPEPPDPVNQISQAIEKIPKRNGKPSTSKDLN